MLLITALKALLREVNNRDAASSGVMAIVVVGVVVTTGSWVMVETDIIRRFSSVSNMGLLL